jgi:hypothetical protein
MSLSDKNLIKFPRISRLPAFRFPDVQIEGLDTTVDTTQETGPPECGPAVNISEFFERIEVGTPKNLQVEGEPRVVRKWSGTYVDIEVSFDSADGAAYHQFRVAKIPEDAE